MKENKSIGIIGAGIAGLTCAYNLQKAGFQVKIFELEGHIGGRMLSRTVNGYVFDTGAKTVDDNYSHLIALCKELKIDTDLARLKSNTHINVYLDDKLFDGKFSFSSIMKLTFLSKYARIRLLFFMLFIYWKASQNRPFETIENSYKTHEPNAYDYLRSFIGKDEVDKLINPLYYCVFLLDLRETTVSNFLETVNFFSKGLPNIYFFSQGINVVYENLAKKLDIIRSTPVTRVEAKNKKVLLEADGVEYLFDKAVLAIPAYQALKIYQNPTPPQKKILTIARYSATIVIAFLVPIKPIKDLFCIAVPYEQSSMICDYLSTYIGYRSNNPLPSDEEENVACIYLHEKCALEMMALSDEEIFSKVKKEFLKICPPLRPYAHRIKNFDLQRWPHAIPKWGGTYPADAHAFWQHGQGEQNVYFAGDYLNANWVEGALRCGEHIANLLIRA